MNPTVIEMIAYHMALRDPSGKDPEDFVPLVKAALEGARAEIAGLRGDPRGYLQGFHDPLGCLIGHIDALLSEKPVGG